MRWPIFAGSPSPDGLRFYQVIGPKVALAFYVPRKQKPLPSHPTNPLHPLSS